MNYLYAEYNSGSFIKLRLRLYKRINAIVLEDPSFTDPVSGDLAFTGGLIRVLNGRATTNLPVKSRNTVFLNQSSHSSSSVVLIAGDLGSSTVQNCCSISSIGGVVIIVNNVEDDDVTSCKGPLITQPRCVCMADERPGDNL